MPPPKPPARCPACGSTSGRFDRRAYTPPRRDLGGRWLDGVLACVVCEASAAEIPATGARLAALKHEVYDDLTGRFVPLGHLAESSPRTVCVLYRDPGTPAATRAAIATLLESPSFEADSSAR